MLLIYAAATDNHIGYLEKDPIRCNDSLEAFEEVLRIAKDHDVRILLSVVHDLIYSHNFFMWVVITIYSQYSVMVTSL